MNEKYSKIERERWVFLSLILFSRARPLTLPWVVSAGCNNNSKYDRCLSPACCKEGLFCLVSLEQGFALLEVGREDVFFSPVAACSPNPHTYIYIKLISISSKLD